MSTIFANADQIHAVFTRMFDEINAGDPHALAKLERKKMVVCFNLTDPETQLWVDGRRSPVEPTFGTQDLRASLTVTTTGDDLHEVLLGTLPLGKAVSSRRLKPSGSIFKAMQLEDLLHQCQKYYPGVAADLLNLK